MDELTRQRLERSPQWMRELVYQMTKQIEQAQDEAAQAVQYAELLEQHEKQKATGVQIEIGDRHASLGGVVTYQVEGGVVEVEVRGGGLEISVVRPSRARPIIVPILTNALRVEIDLRDQK